MRTHLQRKLRRGCRLRGVDVAGDLHRSGIIVRSERRKLIGEEASLAYNDVDDVIAVAEQAGQLRPVLPLRPKAAHVTLLGVRWAGG